MAITLQKPYLIFIGDADDEQTTAKTAMGIYYWKPEWCIGQLRLTQDSVKLNIPEMDIETAVNAGAKTLVVGVANVGGVIKKEWISTFKSALEHDLDLASGMFDKLADIPELVAAENKANRNIFDVRYYDGPIPEATGRKRTGKRLLTIGTDCAVGKMFTSLAITREMRSRNMNVDFRATGQTGIFIAESGIPADNISAEFVAGAAEMLSPDNAENHWDIIEGQGSILHPITGSMLALIHGSQPDAMVLCHEPTRKTLHGLDYKVPSIEECIAANEQAAHLTNSKAKVIGISVNTQRLDEAEKYLEALEDKYNLPTIDPLLTGPCKIVDVIEKLSKKSTS